METEAYFNNIPDEIAKLLSKADSEIILAVAWFTDSMLFNELCRIAGLGVRVRIAVLDDHINRQPGRLNFTRIEEISRDSHVYLIPSGGRKAIMHHKFCVIDRNTLITGSYNWTVRAKKNDENITIIKDNTNICQQYIQVFDSLLVKYRITEKPPIDSTHVKRRLEAVKSLLLLDDWETVYSQMENVKRATAEFNLEDLYEHLAIRDRDAAIMWIERFVQRAGEIVIAEDVELTFLQLELRCLELQLVSLSDTKAEIERVIQNFTHQTNYVLGSLLTRYLQLKALKQHHISKDDFEKDRAEAAQSDYESYRKTNEQTRESTPPLQLSVEDTKAIKRLYREASQKVHPDKVGDEDKKRATELFTKLRLVYKNNDIVGVRAIHASVKNGNLFVDVATSLTEIELLGRKVIQLRESLSTLGLSVNKLKETSSYKQAISVDDLELYFEQQRVALNQEIEILTKELCELEIEIPTDY